MKSFKYIFVAAFIAFSISSCATRQTPSISEMPDIENVPLEAIEGSEAYYHFTRAKLHFYEKRFYYALRELKLAEQIDPDSSKIKDDMGLSYLMLGIDENAIIKFEESIKIDPSNPLPYKSLGRIYTAKKTKDDVKFGRKKLLKAIELNDQDHEVYLYLAINSVYSNDIDRAEEYLNSSLDLYTKDARVYFYLGSINIHNNDLESAERNLKKSLEINPLYYPAFVSLTDILEKNNKIEEAIFTYERGISSFPLNKEIFISYGTMLYRENMYDEALIQFENAEVIDNSDIDIKYRIGLLLTEKKEFQKSIEAFEKILQIDPDNQKVKYYLALNHIQLENYEEAEKYLNEVTIDSDLYSDSVVQRAYLYELKQDYNKALEILETEYKSDKSNPTVVNFLGALYRR